MFITAYYRRNFVCPPGDPKMHCDPREKLEISTYPLPMSLIELTYKARILLIIHYSKQEKFTYFRSKKKVAYCQRSTKRMHKKATNGPIAL